MAPASTPKGNPMDIIHSTPASSTVALPEESGRMLSLSFVVVYITNDGEVKVTPERDARTVREQTDAVAWEHDVIEQHGGTVLHTVYGEYDWNTGERSVWRRM